MTLFILCSVAWLFMGFVSQVLDKIECGIRGSTNGMPAPIVYLGWFAMIPISLIEICSVLSKRVDFKSPAERIAEPIVKRLKGERE